jgi:hypothetical protein
MSAYVRCEKRVTHCRRVSVFTTILAYLIAFTGLAMIAAGTWGALILISEKTVRIPLRYYATDVGNDGSRPWPGWACPSLAPAAGD